MFFRRKLSIDCVWFGSYTKKLKSILHLDWDKTVGFALVEVFAFDRIRSVYWDSTFSKSNAYTMKCVEHEITRFSYSKTSWWKCARFRTTGMTFRGFLSIAVPKRFETRTIRWKAHYTIDSTHNRHTPPIHTCRPSPGAHCVAHAYIHIQLAERSQWACPFQ